ncbi:MAG: dihydropteroate synthase, partial [Planctomycetes bacterium]|nr:dihydropteroate synthase [Planctomycetota bacterium]
MDMSGFIVIGENIHCTRIVKLGGKHTVELPDGRAAVAFTLDGADRLLPIPDDWAKVSPAFAQQKVKHIALAVHQARNGRGDDRRAGEDYLLYAARRQVDAGAAFLDVNVDEYSNDPAVQVETMRWLATFLAERFETPLSIDSSRVETVAAGLEASRRVAPDRPVMVN